VDNVLTIQAQSYKVSIPLFYARKSVELFQKYYPLIDEVIDSFQNVEENHKIILSLFDRLSRKGGLSHFVDLLNGVRIDDLTINDTNYDLIFAGRLDLLGIIIYETIKYNWSIILEKMENIIIMYGALEDRNAQVKEAISNIIHSDFLIWDSIASGCAYLWEMDNYYYLKDALDLRFHLFMKHYNEMQSLQNQVMKLVG